MLGYIGQEFKTGCVSKREGWGLAPAPSRRRAWGESELKLLLLMREDGDSVGDIALVLSRSAADVGKKLREILLQGMPIAG